MQIDSNKVKYACFGVVLTVSLQLCWSLFRRKGKVSTGIGNNGSIATARLLSPLHHLDFAKLKSRSSSFKPGKQLGDSPIYQIVLTGGPSGGKFSTMTRLDKVLREDHGFDVYLCPEVATLLLNAGARYPGLNSGEELVAFEVSLVELQLQMELSFYQIAVSTGRPSVIVFDRGLLDFAAYTPTEKWGLIMNHNQWICDGILNCAAKYDLVLHMESAAVGAEAHFQGREGYASKEELEEAKSLDKKILTCWRSSFNRYRRLRRSKSSIGSHGF